MIKENQKYLNRFHVVLDALVIYCSFCLSYYIRYICPLFKDIFPRFGYWRQLWQYQGILHVLIPVYLILYAKFNLYKPKRFQNRTSEYANLIKANSIGMVFFFIYIIFMKIPHVSRSLQLMFYVLTMLLTIAERAAIRYALERTRRKGFNLKHVVVIGFSAAAEAYIDRIKSNPQWGYTIHGIFDDNLKADFSYRNTFCIGKLKDVEKFLQNTSMDEVAIALSLKEYYKLGDMVAICEKSGVHTKFVPDYYKFISTNPVTEDLNGLPVINIRNVPLTNTVSNVLWTLLVLSFVSFSFHRLWLLLLFSLKRVPQDQLFSVRNESVFIINLLKCTSSDRWEYSLPLRNKRPGQYTTIPGSLPWEELSVRPVLTNCHSYLMY